MMRWLIENVGLMLLALPLAVVVWVVAQWNDDPILVDDLSIPVQVKNLPRETYLVDGWQQEVRVRLRAAQSAWEQLKPEQFEAFLNLSPPAQGPLDPGLYQVPVDASTDLESVVILGVEPTWVEVELEAIRERPVPVEVTVRGEPELGYQAGQPEVLSDTVKVRGPASLATQVTQLAASISLQGDEKETVEEVVPLTPVDAASKRVNGVTLDPERVRVRVPMRKLFNYKEMIVDVEVLGEPAPDYHVVGMSVNPEIVRVVGSASILDDLPGVLSTVPISIGGRTENVIERLPLVLDPGIATVYPSEPVVQVTVQIAPDQGSVTLTRTLTFQGLQTNLEAVASPQVVEVILSGPRPRLSALLPDDVPVILDLSGLGLGQVERLAPVVLQPEGITVDSVIPSIVQVEIVRKSTNPTPKPQE
jgi:YbbR domain-containing protein